MITKNLIGLLVGFILSMSDALGLSIIKDLSIGRFTNNLWMIIPTLIYGLAPLIAYIGIKHYSITIINIIWDMSSDIVITLIALFIFREHLSKVKTVALFMAFIALFLLTYEKQKKDKIDIKK